MSITQRLFRRSDDRDALVPLYRAVVERGRERHWYLEGGVADTLDGRFDMIAAILSLVLIRLEHRADDKLAAVQLTELFVNDMDGQLRQIGIGDMMVGKHIGRMMSALGGRLSAYREALSGGDLEAALVRNLYRGEEPDDAALTHVSARLHAFHLALAQTSVAALLAGELPAA